RADPAGPPAASPRERRLHAAHRLRRARQLRALLPHRVRERRQLRRGSADQHRQSRGAQGAPLSGGVAPAGETVAGAAAGDSRRLGHVRWSLLFGNFVIGCGVMAPVGTLPDVARSLDVSVAVAGQLVAVAAVMMCFGAPLLASWVGSIDRRKLLAASLAWYAIGHALCALMPSFPAVRAVTVLGAAVFTPQAAAAIGAMSPPAERAGAITFIFIGWSVASVVGMP